MENRFWWPHPRHASNRNWLLFSFHSTHSDSEVWPFSIVDFKSLLFAAVTVCHSYTIMILIHIFIYILIVWIKFYAKFEFRLLRKSLVEPNEWIFYKKYLGLKWKPVTMWNWSIITSRVSVYKKKPHLYTDIFTIHFIRNNGKNRRTK